jgi:hypothetical protein
MGGWGCAQRPVLRVNDPKITVRTAHTPHRHDAQPKITTLYVLRYRALNCLGSWIMEAATGDSQDGYLIFYVRSKTVCADSEAKFLVTDWGDIVDSGFGLS